MPRWGGVKQNKSEIRKANMTSNLNWVFGTGFTDKQHLYKDLKWVDYSTELGRLTMHTPGRCLTNDFSENYTQSPADREWAWKCCSRQNQCQGPEMGSVQSVSKATKGLIRLSTGEDQQTKKVRSIQSDLQDPIKSIGSYKEYRILYSLSYRILQATLSTSSSE